jgi:hypothetical protein
MTPTLLGTFSETLDLNFIKMKTAVFSNVVVVVVVVHVDRVTFKSMNCDHKRN